MPWQLILQVRDVNGAPIQDAGLELSIWTGAGNVLVKPRQTIGDTFSFTVTDAVITIIIDLVHPRFAPLALNLVRSPGEMVWRWTDPRQRILTQGVDVVVEATMFRTRAAPIIYIPEEELVRRAAAANAPLEALQAKARKERKPVPVARIGNLNGVLRDKDNFYRFSGGAVIPSFHLMAADPLGDDKAAGWKRFKSTVISNLSPWRNCHIQMVEYGEVGTNGPYGPKFLVGVFLPNELLRVGRKTLDFMVWFTPDTHLPNYPQVEHPYRGDYPYAMMAMGDKAPYQAAQNYVTLPYAHLNPVQHFLAYQMVAAKRACAIVVPIAPSAHFELWQSPTTLMRMLKEICRWLPRDDDGRHAKLHPAPPTVGRVGVSGFSRAGNHLAALLNRQGADIHFRDKEWGIQRDAADFESAWGELWAIDNNVFLGSSFNRFLNFGASWSRHGDRHFRIYKNEFTGKWDPSKEPPGEFSRAMKNATIDSRGSGSHWAISMAEPSGRIHAISVSKTYVVSPAEKEEPTMPDNKEHTQTHENMPRLFFGHAAVTSGYTRMT